MTITVFPHDEFYSYFDATPSQIASRISALNVAAKCVISGDSLCDKNLVHTVGVELMATSAWLARQLENYHINLEEQKKST